MNITIALVSVHRRREGREIYNKGVGTIRELSVNDDAALHVMHKLSIDTYILVIVNALRYSYHCLRHKIPVNIPRTRQKMQVTVSGSSTRGSER